MSGNLLQSLRADEAILALLTLFQSGKQESKNSIQCYLPVLAAFTVIFFLFVSVQFEGEWDRQKTTANEAAFAAVFSIFFWGGGAVTQRVPFLPQRCVTSQKASEKKTKFSPAFSNVVTSCFLVSVKYGLWAVAGYGLLNWYELQQMLALKKSFSLFSNTNWDITCCYDLSAQVV